VGWDRDCTPDRNIRLRFHQHKHTSLIAYRGSAFGGGEVAV
jgi:hypothetical protein